MGEKGRTKKKKEVRWKFRTNDIEIGRRQRGGKEGRNEGRKKEERERK